MAVRKQSPSDEWQAIYRQEEKERYILLYSDEYKAYFVADHRIVAERTSDKVEDYWANHPETGAIVSYGHHPRLPYLPS